MIGSARNAVLALFAGATLIAGLGMISLPEPFRCVCGVMMVGTIGTGLAFAKLWPR